MIEGLCIEAAGGGFIREHNIESVRLQLMHEWSDLSLTTDDVNRIGVMESRFQNLERDQLRQRIGDPDIQPQCSFTRALLHRVHQFSSGREDFICVTEDEMTGLGEGQVASAASEKFFAQRLLKEADLRADRRLRDVQSRGCLSNATFSGDHPKVTQVMKIQVFHSRTIHSQKLSA